MSPIEALLACCLAASVLLARLLHRRAACAQTTLRTIFEAAPVGTLVLDADDRITEANGAAARLACLSRGSLVGRPLAELLHPDDRALLRVGLAQLRHDVTGELVTEMRLLSNRQAGPTTACLHATRLAAATGCPSRIVVQLLDITERKQTESQLRHLADHDSLTGLLNRRGFERELDRHLAAGRRNVEGAVVVLDLDHFKPINDTHGHAAGDRLLTQVAQALHDRLRATDTIARLGGDEFAVLLPHVDQAAASAVAHSLVETLRERAFVDAARAVTVSVGVVMLQTQPACSAAEAVAAADVAMYEAKAVGGDGYASFTAPQASAA